MKLANMICFVVLLSSTFIYAAKLSEKAKIDSAMVSMNTWLSIIDNNEYSESWYLTGTIFQKQLSDSQWVKSLENARFPLGKMISRKVKSTVYKTALPGVPDGEYVIAVFETVFEKKRKSVETLTSTFENDSWKPVGHFIK